MEGDVADPIDPIPFGKARHMREGDQLTVVSWSAMVPKAAEAADQLASEGTGIDLFDLRTIWPWDKEAIVASVRKTGRLLVVHESVEVGGFGAEVVASVIDELGPDNVKAVKRLGAPRSPIPFSPPLEDEVRVTTDKIVSAAKSAMAP